MKEEEEMLTSVGQNAPGHDGDVDATESPASQQRTEEFHAAGSRNEFTEVGDEDRERTS